jgi:hypothetical protein
MRTSTVITVEEERIEVNEKLIPGLVAGGLIYFCDEHQAYHLRDDHGEERALKIVRMAAECNDMPAWQDDKPLDPRGSPMIYTVGDRAEYNPRLEDFLEVGTDFHKLGKGVHGGKPYAGGSVWQTATEAQDYLNRESLSSYSVYGILADWDIDTEQLAGEPFRRLLRDAQIVCRPQIQDA